MRIGCYLRCERRSEDMQSRDLRIYELRVRISSTGLLAAPDKNVTLGQRVPHRLDLPPLSNFKQLEQCRLRFSWVW